MISTTAFGLETEAQSKEHSDYVENAIKLTSGNESNSTLREKLRLTVMIIVFSRYFRTSNVLCCHLF